MLCYEGGLCGSGSGNGCMAGWRLGQWEQDSGRTELRTGHGSCTTYRTIGMGGCTTSREAGS